MNIAIDYQPSQFDLTEIIRRRIGIRNLLVSFHEALQALETYKDDNLYDRYLNMAVQSLYGMIYEL